MRHPALKAAHRAFASIALVVYSSTILALPVSAQTAAKVNVPVGTVVELVFDSTVSPAAVTIGQRVSLRVAAPVVANGKTVVAAGAMATGEVTTASKQGAVGKEAQIGVVVKSVVAVDGQTIPLDGTKVVTGENHQASSIIITLLCCILGLLQKGGSAEIPAGSSVRATVAAPVEVSVP